MFRSFRKKAVKEPVEEPVRKTSLPDITSQDVQWPEDLVDIAAIRHTPPPEPQLQGAAPISFQPDEPGTTSFHKPFRRFAGRSHDGGDRSISSIYMSHPPSSFPANSGPATRVGQRRTRVAPKFNLMVSVSRARVTVALCGTQRRDLGCWRSRYRQDIPLTPFARHCGHLSHLHRRTTRFVRPLYARWRQGHPSHPIRHHRYPRIPFRSRVAFRHRYSRFGLPGGSSARIGEAGVSHHEVSRRALRRHHERGSSS